MSSYVSLAENAASEAQYIGAWTGESIIAFAGWNAATMRIEFYTVSNHHSCGGSDDKFAVQRWADQGHAIQPKFDYVPDDFSRRGETPTDVLLRISKSLQPQVRWRGYTGHIGGDLVMIELDRHRATTKTVELPGKAALLAEAIKNYTGDKDEEYEVT